MKMMEQRPAAMQMALVTFFGLKPKRAEMDPDTPSTMEKAESTARVTSIR